MQTTLGPHTLTCVAPDGQEGEITVIIEPGPDKTTDLGDGDCSVDKTASVYISSSWFERVMTLSGADDIQLVYRLIRVADTYVQKVCRDNGYQLYKYFPGDVSGDFGIY